MTTGRPAAAEMNRQKHREIEKACGSGATLETALFCVLCALSWQIHFWPVLRHRQSVRVRAGLAKEGLQTCIGRPPDAAVHQTDISTAVVYFGGPAGNAVFSENQKARTDIDTVRHQIAISGEKHAGK